MNQTVAVVAIVLMAVLVSLIGLVLVRRLAPIDELSQHTDVAGYVYPVIGVIYAVVLALVVTRPPPPPPPPRGRVRPHCLRETGRRRRVAGDGAR